VIRISENVVRRTAGRRTIALTMVAIALQLSGCQQKMADQPSYRPLEASRFFADGRSARPQVPGTVSQGPLQTGQLLFTGRTGAANTASSSAGSTLGGKPLENYSTQLPFSLTAAELQRGQQRFTIYCAVCHGTTGHGDGSVVLRGYTRPPSYITDDSRGLQRRGIQMSLRDVPIGYLFEVVSKGYGAMADYSAQVPAHDRWDIVAYIRALQFSQQIALEKLPQSQQAEAKQALEQTP
jgi:mono/diheme cytochrome c family protein